MTKIVTWNGSNSQEVIDLVRDSDWEVCTIGRMNAVRLVMKHPKHGEHHIGLWAKLSYTSAGLLVEKYGK